VIDGLLYNLLMLTAWVVGVSIVTLALVVTWMILATTYDLILKGLYNRRLHKRSHTKNH
jgi:multisubunit Na+/H+ antiporter MnhC subunit